ncbi:methanolan biosynthesis protein EpsI [Pseudoalteromonas sp. SR43-6]|uniref:methanolan biosynthesis protein EpsI n=1 Tax=Pseudoalteromonas TaxID=53246 RepID=UPI0015FBD2D5|nr:MULTISPECIES: methanolan biosynthesis protein EpsI [Pseudoalteromonas]MBB1287498.1 methanolan biosynthesis protein EpsI [Pseudoalteromonas sp. SR41-5]MBB1338618.1 methanolan biosynthesis protein EpsI [Pseudoalteromonas sp. SR44-2]MBB1373372.1 methanolan biosynthesis protein EpsI [Pseudoalteromonas sp. SR43-6]MBB1376985.1 methanolan biosynthesis protein EpsI [Pseudoalteromonas sp. SR43-2]MBB1412139.1 methanolan biosynthesis protein EpsI [Pseudoalteromonas sp. SG43-8]
MIIYIIGLSLLVIILCVALYVIYSNVHKSRVRKSKEYNVLFDKDTIVDELITQLTEKNQTQENQDKTAKGKEEILATFVELHRSGSFCAHLSEQEIIYFVKKKLNMESNING